MNGNCPSITIISTSIALYRGLCFNMYTINYNSISYELKYIYIYIYIYIYCI